MNGYTRSHEKQMGTSQSITEEFALTLLVFTEEFCHEALKEKTRISNIVDCIYPNQ